MKLLTAVLCVFFIVSEVSAEVRYVFGPGVSAAEQRRIVKAVKKAETELQKRYSFKPSAETVLFASRDTEFLAKTYANMRGGTNIARKRKQIDSWIFAEAFYRGVMLNLSNKSARNAKAIENAVIHELFHVFQYEVVGPKSKRCCAQDRVSVLGPTWLMEGSAAFFQNVVDRRNLKGFLSHGRKNKRQLGQKGLAGIETSKGMKQVQDGYAISGFAISLLVEQSGEMSLAEFYRSVGRGESWKAAFSKSFGVSAEEFYNQF